MNKLHLHFDLGNFDPTKEYFIQGHGKREKLSVYSDHVSKLEAHKIQNSALALVSEAHHHKLTHFIENIELPHDQVSRLSIVTPAENPADILPDLVTVFFHIPPEIYRRVVEQEGHAGTPHPLILDHLGVSADQLDEQNHADIKAAATLAVLPPLMAAQSIVYHHPEIGTINTTVAAKIFAKYMQNKNDFTQLVNYISNNPGNATTSWYNKTHSVTVDPVTMKESPMPPTDLKFKDGKPMDWPTDQTSGQPVIPLYELTDEQTGASDGGVMAAATTVVQSVLKATKNDSGFSGALWTRSDATVSTKQSEVTPVAQAQIETQLAAAGVGATSEGNFSVKCESNKQYGLDLYGSDISFTNNTVSFPVKNWPNRMLSVYIEYQKEDGTPIPWSVLKNTKEGQKLVQPDGLISDVFAAVFAKHDDTTTKLFWGVLSSGNNVFGIPFPTNPEDIGFAWPHDAVTGDAIASRAEVFFGGLGAANGFSDWETDVDLGGLIGTAVLNYGVTATFMAFSVKVIGPLQKKLMSSEIKYPVLAFAIPMGIVAIIVSAAFWKDGNAKWVLSKISNFVAGFIFGSVANFALDKIYKDAIEELIEESVANLTTQEALEQIPYAGWALKAASLASSIASLAATTVECLASPATYKMQVQETMELTVVVKPDPKLGTEHQAPIWPMVADHWLMTLKYPKDGKFEGGTTFVKAGPMPGQKDAPIEVVYSGIPAGGQIEIVFNVYSNSDWIAGTWNSGLKSATPIDGKLAYTGAITANLVPLTPSVTYREKQRIGFDHAEQKHTWITTSFSINAQFQVDLDSGKLSSGFHAAFTDNGVQLPANSEISVTTVATGKLWKLLDQQSAIEYRCQYVQIYDANGTALYEISVQNITRPAPPLPNPKTNCGTGGTNHNLCDLVDMTIDNKAYQLGYAWRASGMSMPKDKITNPVDNSQMYTLQSISTLNQPSDLIVQSAIGFSQMPFIAYNQFGLTPLFALDFTTYGQKLDAANTKPVPEDLITAFAAKGYALPPNTTVLINREGLEWRFLDSGNNVIFDLIYATTVVDGNITNIINVFNYVVPKITNFYMDPRPGPDGYYHLRGVSFHDGIPGSYQFDVEFDPTEANSWGAFPIPKGSTLYQMAVHPAGFIVAIDYALDKMWTLHLPGEPATMAAAPKAMPLSGSGILNGLISQPKALTIASDGRILILEQGNQRIQSFDVNGNPVAGFKGSLSATMPNELAATLDRRSVDQALSNAYQTAAPDSYLRQSVFAVHDNSPVVDLDAGKVDATLADYFKKHLVELPTAASDIDVVVNVNGSSWFITDKVKNVTYDVRWNGTLYNLSVYNGPNIDIEVVAAGKEWKISDRVNSLTFTITSGKTASDPLNLQQLVSTAKMRIQNAAVQYLDIAVENQGYIYVLYFEGAGDVAAQYMLDIYKPDGTILFDKPLTGLAAARMAVDQWRSLWTLNYEVLLGPNNRTEPSVSGWIPSTPDAPTAS